MFLSLFFKAHQTLSLCTLGIKALVKPVVSKTINALKLFKVKPGPTEKRTRSLNNFSLPLYPSSSQGIVDMIYFNLESKGNLLVLRKSEPKSRGCDPGKFQSLTLLIHNILLKGTIDEVGHLDPQCLTSKSLIVHNFHVSRLWKLSESSCVVARSIACSLLNTMSRRPINPERFDVDFFMSIILLRNRKFSHMVYGLQQRENPVDHGKRSFYILASKAKSAR